MAKIRNVAAGIVIVAVSAVSGNSVAAETRKGWYVGADIGHAKLSLDNQNTIGETDLSDTAVSVRGGHAFSRHFAVEATYSDLGNYRYTLDNCLDVCVPESESTEFRHSVTRLDLSLVGRIPLGERLEAYARAGVASTTLETEARNLLGASRSERSDVSGVYGVGLRARLSGPWSLRLQWDRGSYSDRIDLDVDSFWLGAEYQFGRRPD